MIMIVGNAICILVWERNVERCVAVAMLKHIVLLSSKYQGECRRKHEARAHTAFNYTPQESGDVKIWRSRTKKDNSARY